MTATTEPLTDLLTRASAILLDFDGPVCRLFAGRPAPALAERLVQTITAHGADVPAVPPSDDGPLQVLRRTADVGDDQLTRHIADQVRDAEVTAAATAAPTPGAAEMLRAAHDSGRPVVMVSNNSAEAVRAYLNVHDLNQYVAHVIGRYDGMNPRLLKPDTHLINLALTALGQPPQRTVLVGDSVSDIHAAHAAGVPVLAYANKPGKREAMTAAHADIIIDTMTHLADALLAIPARP